MPGATSAAGGATAEGGGKITFAVADELELERILDAKSDLECLKVSLDTFCCLNVFK